MISKNHSNRQAHNWLAYQSIDHFLEKYIPCYKGVIYDLGSGESPYKDFFLSHANEYVAVDWTQSYHNTAVDIEADLNGPRPIESGAADTVVSVSVLDHLREPQTMLNEAFRILKPDGVILIQVPWQWWVHEEPFDFFRFTPYGLRYLLTKPGFVDIVVEPQSGFFTMWILKFNYFTERSIQGPGLIRFAIRSILLPIWYLGQKVAPYLDKLDKNWPTETSGYFVTARKPQV
jgi:SAM-dependent methyltransferase